jgi:hypothetical protein
MGKPLVRFCEGREFNGDMEEILWHRRETRRQTEKTNLLLQFPESPVYSKTRCGVPRRGDFDEIFSVALGDICFH